MDNNQHLLPKRCSRFEADNLVSTTNYQLIGLSISLALASNIDLSFAITWQTTGSRLVRVRANNRLRFRANSASGRLQTEFTMKIAQLSINLGNELESF